jgi:3-hydroxybutyryl-CoA dehydrogenase
MLKNAPCIKEHFVDQVKPGAQSGEGYYTCPDPLYGRADFLEVPDRSRAD